jgi:hypothetical protein
MSVGNWGNAAGVDRSMRTVRRAFPDSGGPCMQLARPTPRLARQRFEALGECRRADCLYLEERRSERKSFTLLSGGQTSRSPVRFCRKAAFLRIGVNTTAANCGGRQPAVARANRPAKPAANRMALASANRRSSSQAPRIHPFLVAQLPGPTDAEPSATDPRCRVVPVVARCRR